MNWLGMLFITTTVMLAVDLLTGFGLWMRSNLAWLRSSGLLLASVIIFVAIVQGLKPPTVVRHDVTLSDLPPELDSLTLVALSDLHLGSQLDSRWLADRVAQVQALRPDIIVLLGDYFDGHRAPDPILLPLLSGLKAPLGVYAVTGNHEYFRDSSSTITLIERAGIQWLQDHWLQIRPGLILAGVDDLTTRWRYGKSEDFVTPVLAGRPEGATVLFSHSPLQVAQAAVAGADLMLSGHNHGGQIWPFGYLVQLFYPFLAGRHEVSGMTLIISRGTGLWGPRMRLWHQGEILLITLRTNTGNSG
jgi:predicted MPP superfamily phosphohydrolase